MACVSLLMAEDECWWGASVWWGWECTGTRKPPAFKLAKVTVNAKLMLQALDDLEPLCVWMTDSAEDHSRSGAQLTTVTTSVLIAVFHVDLPLTSTRHHLSYDDCLEDKRENYQNCSVLYVCTAVVHNDTHTHIWAVLEVECRLGFSLCALGLAFCVFLV